MKPSAIRNLIRQGEDSSRQFKQDVTNADSLAAEMVAMSNGIGGMILIGVGDEGTLPGLSSLDVRRVNGFLTVERILAGISNIRNPILISYVAKGLLPYRGLGSGIKRALEEWPDIAFTDDRDGCQFTAAVARKPAAAGSIESPADKHDTTREKTREKILRVLASSPEISMVGLTEHLGISAKGVEWQIREMKKAGILKRIGPDKGGHWKVISP
jgi:predicted HTH transcriptional regulator